MTDVAAQAYSLGQAQHEYERVRAQALAWERVTEAVLDGVGVRPGARCLDVGSGPGEVMRLLAERVGPSGEVVGVDADPVMSELAGQRLTAARHHQCRIVVRTVRGTDPLPDGPYDVVFSRLLLFHLPDRVQVLERMWDAVAPGGALVVQEYDVRPVMTLPELDSLGRARRFILDAFRAAGADPAIGSGLPQLFEQAGLGRPDRVEVAGRLDPLSTGQAMVAAVARSLLPVALRTGLTTEDEAADLFAAVAADAAAYPDAALLWPLLVSVSTRRPPA